MSIASQKSKMRDRSVIIIDDDDLVCETLTMFCEELALFRSIVVAKDGSIATQKLNMQKFDLILLDINMPKKSGIQLIKEFDGRHLNVIESVMIISGELGKEELTSAVSHGCKHFLVKPFDFDTFKARAEKLLSAPKPAK